MLFRSVQVAVGVHHHIHHAVPRQLIEHVIEERNAGVEVGDARAIKVDRNLDLRFLGVALNGGDAG